ncbi:MAG: hypothetical protein PHS93_07730 [Candidatus Omnitrophica bacterium]|nr:hypothetical protein [Candidatus Omnitrophota bacterium]
MANNTFKYPNSTSPTLTLTFDTKGHLVDGSDFILRPNQKTGLSKGGTRYSESFGANKQVHQFTFIVPITKVSSETDQADVVTFFATVLGAVESFAWTDQGGTERTVRCINDELTFRTLQNAPKYRKCTLLLETQ